MTRTYHVAQTEEDQLKALAETKNGMLLFQFKNPSDEVVMEALRLDGMALKFLTRPTLAQCEVAITQNSDSVSLIPPKLRGKDGITAIPDSLQKLAFSIDPVVLLRYPSKFDDAVEPPAPRKGLKKFAEKINDAFLAEVGDGPIHPANKPNLQQALIDFYYKGIDDVPLFSWYKKHYPQLKGGFSLIEGMHSRHSERVKEARNFVLSGSLPKADDGEPPAALPEDTTQGL